MMARAFLARRWLWLALAFSALAWSAAAYWALFAPLPSGTWGRYERL